MKWGQLLHEAAMPVAHTANVMKAWAQIGDHAGRRFSVHVDAALEAGAPEADVETAREAATLLLGLPWELLHDGDGLPVPGREAHARPPAPAEHARRSTCRWSPRPSASCSSPRGRRTTPAATSTTARARCRWSRRWRRSAGSCSIHVLSPPTLPALREELDRARARARAVSRRPLRRPRRLRPAGRPRRAVLRGPAGHRQARQAPARHRLHRASSARCCAITASRSSSSKPARPRRPRRRPSPSPPSC